MKNLLLLVIQKMNIIYKKSKHSPSEPKSIVRIHFEPPASFFDDVKPLLHTLRILGRLPKYIADTGLEPCSLGSWPWIYSLASLSIQITLTSISLCTIVESMLHCQDYDEYLFWLMLALDLQHNLLVPFTYWLDGGSLEAYMKSWIKFQNNRSFLERGLTHNMEFSKKNKNPVPNRFISRLSIAIVALVAILTSVEIYFTLDIPIIASIPYAAVYIALISSSVFWCYTCKIIIHLASSVFKETELAIKNNNVNELISCRQHWIGLSGLTSGLGESLRNTFIVTIIITMIAFVVCCYASLSIFFSSSLSDFFVGSALEVLFTFIVIFCICDYANAATKKVGEEFSSKLLVLDVSKCSERTVAEVTLFLHSVKLCPPSVRLSDFITVDRQLITSFIASVITYLIVLLQFRSSDNRSARADDLLNSNDTGPSQLTTKMFN